MREGTIDPDHPDWVWEIHGVFSILSLTGRAEPANVEEAEAPERVRQEIVEVYEPFSLGEARFLQRARVTRDFLFPGLQGPRVGPNL